MRYYKLWAYLDEDDAVLRCSDAIESPFRNWLSPQPWDFRVPEPLVLEVEEGRDLLPFYDAPIPIMSVPMLDRMRAAGVNNIDDYEAVVEDPQTGRRVDGYRAIKVIGAIAAVDEEASESAELDETGFAGTFLDKVIIDEDAAEGALLFRLTQNYAWLVVAESVRDALLSSPDTRGLEFTPLFEVEDDEEEEDDDDYDDEDDDEDD